MPSSAWVNLMLDHAVRRSRLVVLHEDDAMQVSGFTTMQGGGRELTEVPVPADKCYHTNQTSQNLEHTRSMMSPVILLPKSQNHPGEMYDFSEYIHLGHGGSMNVETGESIAPLTVRLRRPDLEAFFYVPSLRLRFQQVALLGLRFAPSEFAAARERASAAFMRTMQQDLLDLTKSLLFAESCWFEARRLIPALVSSDGPRGYNHKLGKFLSREILDDLPGIIAQWQSSMSHEDFDQQGIRYDRLCCLLQPWLDTGRTMNMVRRIDPALVSGCTLLISQQLSHYITHRLDRAIMRTQDIN